MEISVLNKPIKKWTELIFRQNCAHNANSHLKSAEKNIISFTRSLKSSFYPISQPNNKFYNLSL